MLGIHRAAARYEDRKDVPWDMVEKKAGSTNPFCKPWIPALRAYVEHGPANGELVFELREALKTFAGKDGAENRDSLRLLGSKFMAAVNNVAKSFKPEFFPYVVNSLVKAQLASNKVEDHLYCQLAPSDCGKLTKPNRRAAVREMEKLCVAVRVICKALQMDKAIMFKHVTRLDVRGAHLLVDKQSDRNYKKVEEIAQARTWLLKLCSTRSPCEAPMRYSAVAICMGGGELQFAPPPPCRRSLPTSAPTPGRRSARLTSSSLGRIPLLHRLRRSNLQRRPRRP